MMDKIQEAINYAIGTGAIENHEIVDRVREYLNENNAIYDTFSFADLQKIAPELLGEATPEVIEVNAEIVG